MQVSVVIVNWNSKDYLRKCLVSLQKHPGSLRIEIIVVDGASFDGCAEMLAQEFREVVFIQSPENVGFARANNLGAKHATGRCLLLLNPDTEFVEDAISPLYRDLLENEEAGAIGCRLLNSDLSVQTSCVQAFPTVLNQLLDAEWLRRRSPRSRLWGMRPLYDGLSGPVEAEALSGACILICRDCFEEIGGFTESYFMYGEDMDLCYKLNRRGCKILHDSRVTLIHHGGGSSRQAASDFSTMMTRESVRHFLRLHHGLLSAASFRISTFFAALVRLACIAPLALFGRRFAPRRADSFRKWRAILLWSLGRPAGRKSTPPASKAAGVKSA
jgi:N-acetylglucosaminyl-diphospho-decaprenol L-rhamnosyltransferase